jgi:hypothetical protein
MTKMQIQNISLDGIWKGQNDTLFDYELLERYCLHGSSTDNRTWTVEI